MLAEGRVGARVFGDGAQAEARMDRTAAMVVTDGHARYAELCRRGMVYATTTALAGTTVVAGNVSPVAAGAASILSIYNPPGSSRIYEVWKGFVSVVSGTPGAGVMVWNGGPTAVITATTNAVAANQGLSAAVGTARCFTQTALTGSSAQSLIRMMPASHFAGTVAAANTLNFVDLVDGDLMVPEGAVLSIAAPAAGTTWILAAGIVWAEIPTA